MPLLYSSLIPFLPLHASFLSCKEQIINKINIGILHNQSAENSDDTDLDLKCNSLCLHKK